MDSFEWNKIAGAVLFALLVAFGLSIFSELVLEPKEPETPGYVIATAEGGQEQQVQEAEKPIAVLLASADADKGQAAARKCLACHTFGKGEANKVGPNLWGVVMRPIASHEGYEYSEAMQAFAKEAGNWTYEHLNTFLTDPRGTVPQTKMTFAGLKNDSERANVIAYLRTLSDNPEPLPKPVAEGQVPGAEEPVPAEEVQAEEQQGAAEPMAGEGTAMAGQAEAPASGQQQQTAAAEEPAGTQESQAPAAEEQQMATTEAPSEAAMPQGDPVKGKAFARRCLACHSFDQNGPNKVGPHLFGVFGRHVATVEDFSYSDAMKSFSEGGSKTWDTATLNTYLTDPRGVVPGTKMVFPGIKDANDRANVIAYLATLKQ
jgi:cytochrome c